MVNIPGLRTNSSSRLMAYPTVFNILSELGPKESQGSGQTECFKKRSKDVVDALGFPARPSIAAKVPAAGIWHAGQSSSPLAMLRRAVLRADLSQRPWSGRRDGQLLATRWQPLCPQLLSTAFPSCFNVDHAMAGLPLLPLWLTHAPLPERVCFCKFNQFTISPIIMYNRMKISA